MGFTIYEPHVGARLRYSTNGLTGNHGSVGRMGNWAEFAANSIMDGILY